MQPAPRGEPTGSLAIFGIHAGPRIGEQIAVLSPVVTIGQGSQNDVVLPDDSVSTVHARLEYEMGWRITDLDSTNGTYVENVRLAPQVPTPLAYGSLVRFGGIVLHFREADRADPEAARASYSPPSDPAPLAARGGSGFRLPVWAFLLILLVLGAVLFFVLGSPDPAPTGVTGHHLEAALSPVALGAP